MDIIELLEVKYSEADRKLYIKVKWHTGEETLIDAQPLKADDPLRLAKCLLMNPVEKLRSGYWNEWGKKTAKNINCALQRLCFSMTIVGPLMFRILISGKLDMYVEELRPRSIRIE